MPTSLSPQRPSALSEAPRLDRVRPVTRSIVDPTAEPRRSAEQERGVRGFGWVIGLGGAPHARGSRCARRAAQVTRGRSRCAAGKALRARGAPGRAATPTSSDPSPRGLSRAVKPHRARGEWAVAKEGRMLNQRVREKSGEARTTRASEVPCLHDEEDPAGRVWVRQLGRQAARRGAQAHRRARRSLAREARETRGALPGARDDEAVRRTVHAASEGRERADPRRHRRGPARGLPGRRVLAPGDAHPRARRGERRALALERHERARDANRAGTEPGVAASWPGLRGALPRAAAHDSARGAQRPRLRPAERAQARGVARVRAGRVLVGAVVRGVEGPDREGCGIETRASRASADVAALGRMEAARADRSTRGARPGGGLDVTRRIGTRAPHTIPRSPRKRSWRAYRSAPRGNSEGEASYSFRVLRNDEARPSEKGCGPDRPPGTPSKSVCA